jgi:hypothetical protein
MTDDTTPSATTPPGEAPREPFKPAMLIFIIVAIAAAVVIGMLIR